MKKKMLFMLCIVFILVIATTVTVVASNGIGREEILHNVKRCIPLVAAIASALFAKCIALISRRFDEKEEIMVGREA